VSATHPWQVDVSRLRRAQAVQGVILQVILILLVLIAGTVAGLATATVVGRDVVDALAEPGADAGPMPWSQFRSLHAMRDYFQSGSSLYHAGVLGALAAAFTVLSLTVRRRLLPDGVPRRRLVLALLSVAAVYVFFVLVANPFDEISRRVALDREFLFSTSSTWSNAIELSYVMQVPLTVATLALAVAALTPTRIALPGLGAVAGLGYAIVLLCRLPWGPLSRPPEPPESFLASEPRTVRVLVLAERPRTARGALPDAGLATVPPPLGPDAERAAAEAVRTYGLDDLRGTAAARLYAFAPLARFDVATYARRVADLYRKTGSSALLRRLVDVLRSPAPRGPAADAAFEPFVDPALLRFGDAAMDLCRARVARDEVDAAARIKEAARAEGLSQEALATCVVARPAPIATVTGSVRLDGQPAAGVLLALLDERVAGRVDAAPAGQPFDLSLLSAAVVARTDAAGAYRFDRLPSGRYLLAVLLDPRVGPARQPASAPPAWIVVAAPAPAAAPALELTTRFE
jgi:hypothetical protein